jgi:hypothetical protein
MTAVSGSVFTAAQFNQFVRDNLLECPASNATTPGSFFVTDGTNHVVERIPAVSRVDVQEVITATSFADAPTLGPSVTVTTGTHAYIFIAAEIGNTTASSAGCLVGTLISGATSESPTPQYALRQESAAQSEFQRATYARLHTGLTPGSNSFRLQYQTTAGSMNINYREISVLPM